MKKLMMLSAVAALMLGGSAYAADPVTPTVQVTATPAAVYKLAPGEFDEYAHAYLFDDGNAIRFARAGSRYWATMKDGTRVELLAVQQGVFTTAAGTRIAFQDAGDSVVIDNYERLPMPIAATGLNVRMIAAR